MLAAFRFVAFRCFGFGDLRRQPVYRRHNSYKEVEANAVAGLKTRADRLAADARDAHLAVGLVGERVVHVVRQLAVNADRLQTMQHGVSGSFEHVSFALGFGLWATAYQLPATTDSHTADFDARHGLFAVQRNGLDLLNHIHAGDDASKDGVLAIEGRRSRQDDEE